MSLTHTVNFGIGSYFFKGPGSAFSEGAGPGPGPLYKVCQMILNKYLKRYCMLTTACYFFCFFFPFLLTFVLNLKGNFNCEILN